MGWNSGLGEMDTKINCARCNRVLGREQVKFLLSSDEASGFGFPIARRHLCVSCYCTLIAEPKQKRGYKLAGYRTEPMREIEVAR
jgi:hypothetical protein